MGLLDRIFRTNSRKQTVADDPGSALPKVDFQCNICGQVNRGVLLAHAENRECQSCAHCSSSLRMRSLVYLLSMGLFRKPLTLPEFPVDKTIAGLGLSDWEGYANPLAGKFDYTNTFYHREPKLDITEVAGDLLGRFDFLISTDVFEHVPVGGLDSAFRNSRDLLRPGGMLLLTVPYSREAATREHFPSLHEFRIVRGDGKPRLINTTKEGREESFDDLVFHGGEGETLEMRIFSESDLLARLLGAGFTSVQVHGEHFAPYGILWPIDHSLPIVARR